MVCLVGRGGGRGFEFELATELFETTSLIRLGKGGGRFAEFEEDSEEDWREGEDVEGEGALDDDDDDDSDEA